MPIALTDDRAVLSETCVIEEADSLLAWIKEHPGGVVDMERCNHMHAAILQVLLAARPTFGSPPEDAFLKEHVWPLLRNP